MSEVCLMSSIAIFPQLDVCLKHLMTSKNDLKHYIWFGEVKGKFQLLYSNSWIYLCSGWFQSKLSVSIISDSLALFGKKRARSVARMQCFMFPSTYSWKKECWSEYDLLMMTTLNLVPACIHQDSILIKYCDSPTKKN